VNGKRGNDGTTRKRSVRIGIPWGEKITPVKKGHEMGGGGNYSSI